MQIRYNNEISQHKLSPELDHQHMMELYEKMKGREFEASSHSTNFLAFIYGDNSKIVLLENEARAIKSRTNIRSEISDDDDDDNFPESSLLKQTPIAQRLSNKRAQRIERAHDSYWKNVQPLLVDSKGWYTTKSAHSLYILS